MPKTVQIRNIDDDVYKGLQRRAAAVGLSVPEFLRREATRLAKRPTMEEWLDRVSLNPPSSITNAHILEALDEIRGPWPNAGC
jgi:antitoxin FitA